MTKTIALTIEVVTASKVTVLVDVPDGISPSCYASIGQRLFESTPSAMYKESARHFERVSFDKSDKQACLTVRLDDEGQAQLVKKNDLVELTLIECGDLDEFETFILYSGSDDQARGIVTLPATGDEMDELSVRVFPFNDELVAKVRMMLARSFYHGVLPDDAPLTVADFGADVDQMAGSECYVELTAKLRRPRYAYTLSKDDDFSLFKYGLYGDSEVPDSPADIAHAYEQYLKNRSVVASI